MPSIEDDYKRQVNVKKVVKAVKNIGEFALWRSSEDSILLMTQHFILNLNAEQAWEAQCALLVKDLNKWFTIYKGDLVEHRPVEETEHALYYKIVNGDTPNIIGFTELYLGNIAIYASNGGYAGFKRNYIEMIGPAPLLRQLTPKTAAIASDFHVLIPCKFEECQYLVQLLF